MKKALHIFLKKGLPYLSDAIGKWAEENVHGYAHLNEVMTRKKKVFAKESKLIGQVVTAVDNITDVLAIHKCRGS